MRFGASKASTLQIDITSTQVVLKLSAKLYGPYKIIERVEGVAYDLELPPESLIHPVFHASLLKKEIGDSVSICTDLPQLQHDSFIAAPEKVLQTRRIIRGGEYVEQGLIKWFNLPHEDAIWEYKSFIAAQFPDHLLSWGQESSSPGGIVTYYRKKYINKRE